MRNKVVAVVAAVVVIAGGVVVWRLATPDRIDAAWVDSTFVTPPGTREAQDKAAKNYLRRLDVTFGDDDVIQHRLRDGEWTTSGLATFLGRLDVAVTSQATAGDTRRTFLTSTADRAADVTSRALAALALRDDLNAVRDELADDEDASGSIAIGHLLGAWSATRFLGNVAATARLPDAFNPSLGSIDAVSEAPLVADDWFDRVLPLALVTDPGLASLAGGMETAAVRELRLASHDQHAALSTKVGNTSAVGRSRVGYVVQAWADIGHAILQGPGDDDRRQRRLAAWIDRAGALADDIGSPLKPPTGDEIEPYAVFESDQAPWTASPIADRLTKAEPIDVKVAAQRLDRARALMLVAIIDSADAWEERPAGFARPPWDEVVAMDDSAWDDLMSTWQAGTRIQLDESTFMYYMERELAGEAP